MRVDLNQEEVTLIIDAIECYKFEHHYLDIWKTPIPELVLSKMENIVQSSEGKANVG